MYHLLSVKWDIVLTILQSTSAVARSYYLEYCGSYNISLRSPRRIASILLGATDNACSTQWTIGILFGGIYAPATYHLRDPEISKKLATSGPKLTMPSTFQPASSLQNNSIPPLCLISASDAQTAYPAPCRTCIPYVRFFSYTTLTSTLPCFSAQISASISKNPPNLMLSVSSLIPLNPFKPLTLCLYRVPIWPSLCLRLLCSCTYRVEET